MTPTSLVRTTGRMELSFTKMKNAKRSQFVIGEMGAQWDWGSRVQYWTRLIYG